jgi:hypothetical protein
MLNVRIIKVVALGLLACGARHEGQAMKPAPPKVQTAETHAIALTSYADCVVDKDYWLDMRLDATEFVPVVVPSMPMHHASRLEFENQAAFAATVGPGQVARVTFRMLGHEAHALPGRNAWRATYRARILKVEARLPETGTLP